MFACKPKSYRKEKDFVGQRNAVIVVLPWGEDEEAAGGAGLKFYRPYHIYFFLI